jgi:hypothetical protein
MLKQSLTIALVLCVIATMSIGQFAHAQPEGLVLWNKLGSQTEVENSEIGLDGTFSGGGFGPGKFGNAYVVDVTGSPLVTFPGGVVPPYRGVIEFWAKLIDLPSAIPWGAHPTFASIIIPNVTNFNIGLNSNDGTGNGGLTAVAGGWFTTGTGSYGSWTYEQVLGVGQAGDWHHYALVWNKDGIPGVADGTKKLAVFLDGELNSGRWHTPNQNWWPPIGGQLGLVSSENPLIRGICAIDNIKIWNYARTNFCDRLAETPVAIDINPGSDPNSINLGSKGTIPVAILSSADFNATQVDPTTVVLAGASVATRGNKLMAHERDVDGDGRTDLVVKVETEDLDLGQFQNGHVCLAGGTYGGESFAGSDEIAIVPPQGAPPLNPKRKLAMTWAGIKSRH